LPEYAYLHAIVSCLKHNPAQQHYDLATTVNVGVGNYPTMPEALVELAVMQLTGESRPVKEAYGRTNLLTTTSSRGSKYLPYLMYDKGLHSFEKDPVKAM
jgi:hypothetical protein